MPLLSWIPFTPAWTSAQRRKAEHAWSQSLALHRAGHPAGTEGLTKAAGSGYLGSFQHALDALSPPAPEALALLLRRRPNLHPLSEEPLTNGLGDTLLHLWARQPQPANGSTAHQAITRLLLMPVGTDIARVGQAKKKMLRPNADRMDAQMLAARHGNWDVLRGLKPYTHWVIGSEPVREDLTKRHWVDHWAEGVLERLQAGDSFQLRGDDPALSAFCFCAGPDDVARLGKRHRLGRPLARLLAAGVNADLAEFICPREPTNESKQLWNTLNKSFEPNQFVAGPGIASYYLVGAMVSSQPWEAICKVMGAAALRSKPDLRKIHLFDHTGRSPALDWLDKPEWFAHALEKTWFIANAVNPGALPGLPRLLRDLLKDPSTEPVALRIFTALETHYRGTWPPGFRSDTLQGVLEETLSNGSLPAAPRHRL